MENTEYKELVESYGGKAVGLTFNPSNLVAVQAIKIEYANIINELDTSRNEAFADNKKERGRHLAVAITDAETACMRAVKGLTSEL